jgi:hypothetical protein
MSLSPIQQEAIDQASKHGKRLVRWKGGFWTYEGAKPCENIGGGPQVPEWYCRTNTIFALVRRGFMAINSQNCCYLTGKPQSLSE